MTKETDQEGLLCGVDLGGTKVAIALVRADGTIRAKRVLKGHRGVAPREVISRVAGAIRGLADDLGMDLERLPGIGVGTAGHVDYGRGVMIINSNLPGFEGFPLADALQRELGLTVFLDNDANAQAWAEYRFGAGRGFSDMSFVTVSTGVGAGLILKGSVYRGVTGTAGEIGHTIVEPGSRIRCGCGRTGCLMAYTSGLTLPQVVREIVSRGPRLAGSPLWEHEVHRAEATGVGPGVSASDDGHGGYSDGGDYSASDYSGSYSDGGDRGSAFDPAELRDEEITGELIGRGLAQGDPLCRRVVEQYADYLAIGLSNLHQTINPGLIVVGGGLSEWGPVYMDRVRGRFHSLVESLVTELPEIRRARLGADAAVVGAAALPLER